MTKKQVLDRVRELVPESTITTILHRPGQKILLYLYINHLLEAARRTDTDDHILRINSHGSIEVDYLTIVHSEDFLLSPIEAWDKDMTPEEAERMWELLGKALGIN